MNGCGSAHIDAGGTRDPTVTREVDWSHSPQASRQHYTKKLKLLIKRGKGKEDDRETHGAAMTSKKLATPGGTCRDCLRTGVPGGVMLAANAPEGATRL